ncbi:U32 family peptidase [Erysipelotrichaceae bacterium OH741_COT-311]|nr:U32 family peptidase [Erysipelotrichaceae bacterium OH741_COT-311]
MQVKDIELLAPCGSKDAVYAACNAGANAIYLASNRFGARSFAANFSLEELVEVIKYAHQREVSIYVTMNTLIYEDEMEDAIAQVDFLYKHDVDAIIIQDLGLLEVVSKRYPDLELHASTQMHIHNVEGARFMMQRGIKRVVVARETPIDIIKEICNLGIDVEVFVYGALCVSYSGQCFISSILKQRSGNRGSCAQLCRLPYRLYNSTTKEETTDISYMLSLKDLNTIAYIHELIQAGVKSFKIEGRMKRFEYVYEVTKTFRDAIDTFFKHEIYELTKEKEESLKKLFHRGFTKGYVFNENNTNMINTKRPNHMGIELGYIEKVSKQSFFIRLKRPLHQQDGIRIINIKEDIGFICNYLYKDGLLVNQGAKGELIEIKMKHHLRKGDLVYLTSDYHQLLSISKEKEMYQRVLIDLRFTAKINQHIFIHAKDTKGNVVELESEYLVCKAMNQGMDAVLIQKSLDKIADTPYYFRYHMDIDDAIFIPVKVLNLLKREVIEKMMLLKEIVHRDRKGAYQYTFKKNDLQYTEDTYCEIETLNDITNIDYHYLSNNHSLVNDYVYYKGSSVNEKDQYYPTKCASQLGDLNHLVTNAISYTTFNVTNSYAIKFLHDCKINTVFLSLELNIKQIEVMLKAFKHRYGYAANVGIFKSGRRDLMIMKYCLINNTLKDGTKKACALCRKAEYQLLDYNQEAFPLYGDAHCNLRLLDSKDYHFDQRISGVNNYYIQKYSFL